MNSDAARAEGIQAEIEQRVEAELAQRVEAAIAKRDASMAEKLREAEIAKTRVDAEIAKRVAAAGAQIRAQVERESAERLEAELANKIKRHADREREAHDTLERERERYKVDLRKANKATAAEREEKECIRRHADQAVAAEREEMEAAQRKADDALQEVEKCHQLREGSYFTPLPFVWTTKAVAFTEKDFDDLLRSKCPKNGDQYLHTLRAAKDAGNIPAVENITKNATSDDDSSSGSSKTWPLRIAWPHGQVWPLDIFGRRELTGKSAHLIPTTPSNASVYVDVAALALGVKDPDLTPKNLVKALRKDPSNIDIAETIAGAIAEAKQKAVHGSKPRQGWSFSQFFSKKSGLKHSRSNLLRLKAHELFLEDNPCVLIVPVMELDDMKKWDGGGYDAIVMAAAWDSNGQDITVEQVHDGIGMVDPGAEASEEEIELARELLTKFLLGMTYSLLRRDHSHLPNDALTILTSLKGAFSDMKSQQQILVPLATGNSNLHVRKVTFGHGAGQHPPPDPCLLVVKAAVVWSTRNKQQLLVGETALKGVAVAVPAVQLK